LLEGRAETFASAQRGPIVGIVVTILCLALVAIASFSGMGPKIERNGGHDVGPDFNGEYVEGGRRLPSDEARAAAFSTVPYDDDATGAVGPESFVSLSTFPGTVASVVADYAKSGDWGAVDRAHGFEWWRRKKNPRPKYNRRQLSDATDLDWGGDGGGGVENDAPTSSVYDDGEWNCGLPVPPAHLLNDTQSETRNVSTFRPQVVEVTSLSVADIGAVGTPPKGCSSQLFGTEHQSRLFFRRCTASRSLLVDMRLSLEEAMARRCEWVPYNSSLPSPLSWAAGAGGGRRADTHHTPFLPAAPADANANARLSAPFLFCIGHSHNRNLCDMLVIIGNFTVEEETARTLADRIRAARSAQRRTPISVSGPAPAADGRLAIHQTFAQYNPRARIIGFMEELLDVPQALGSTAVDPAARDHFKALLGQARGSGITDYFIHDTGLGMVHNASAFDKGDTTIVAAMRGIAALPQIQAVDAMPTAVLMTRAEWDALHLDPNPAALAADMVRSAAVFLRGLPRTTKLIWQLSNAHVAPELIDRNPTQREDHFNWLVNCMGTPPRVRIYRAINECGAWLTAAAMEAAAHPGARRDPASRSNIENNHGRNQRLLLFDSDRVTRTVAGRHAACSMGHHYLDRVLEVTALELRRLVVRPAAAAAHAAWTEVHLSRRGPRACAFVNASSPPLDDAGMSGWDLLSDTAIRVALATATDHSWPNTDTTALPVGIRTAIEARVAAAMAAVAAAGAAMSARGVAVPVMGLTTAAANATGDYLYKECACMRRPRLDLCERTSFLKKV
jgi:hypothetical protein